MPIQQPEPNALPSGSAPLPAIARNVALGPLDPYAQGADEQPADWGRYIAAVRRYRWWVAVAALLGIAGGYGAARILRPRFQAQATIWIESSARPGAADRGPIRPDQLLEAAGWVDLLKSYVVLDQVVRDLKLYVEPEHAEDSTALSTFSIAEQFRAGHYTLDVDATRHFTLLAEGGAVVQRGVAGDSIGSSIGFRWAPPATSLIPDHKLQFRLVTPRDASQKLADDIEVRIDENGNFLRMMLTGTDPVRIAAILNGVSNREVAVAADLKRAKLTELTKILESQLTSAERNLHNSENSLEGFRIRTITLPSDKTTPLTPGLQITRDPVFSSFFDMKIQREQLRRDRDAIQRVLGSVGDSGLSIEALEVIPAVVQSSELK